MEAFREEVCFELVFERTKTGRMPYALRDDVPNVRTEAGERAKAIRFAFEEF